MKPQPILLALALALTLTACGAVANPPGEATIFPSQEAENVIKDTETQPPSDEPSDEPEDALPGLYNRAAARTPYGRGAVIEADFDLDRQLDSLVIAVKDSEGSAVIDTLTLSYGGAAHSYNRENWDAELVSYDTFFNRATERHALILQFDLRTSSGHGEIWLVEREGDEIFVTVIEGTGEYAQDAAFLDGAGAAADAVVQPIYGYSIVKVDGEPRLMLEQHITNQDREVLLTAYSLVKFENGAYTAEKHWYLTNPQNVS